MRGVKIAKFEPLIVGFVCNECVYAASDLAGTSRMSYPENVRLIRVPCSGQVDIIHILRAFENGADGVFVGGCLKEQCHYVDGNLKAEYRIEYLQNILDELGIEKERLSIQFLSAAMAREFVKCAAQLTDTVKKLGPSPLKKGKPKLQKDRSKRAMMRNMLLNISKIMKTKDADYHSEIWGFATTEIDAEKCVGCGACSFVCKDGAMEVEQYDDKVLIKNTYWRCTACKRCENLCPLECVKLEKGFDLNKLLEGESRIMAKIGNISCARCGVGFLPEPLFNSMEIKLDISTFDSTFYTLCPSCRKFAHAERIVDIHGFSKEKLGRTPLEKP